MKKRGKRYYQKLFRVYPDLVTTVQFREMLGGIGDTFARKLSMKRKSEAFILSLITTYQKAV